MKKKIIALSILAVCIGGLSMNSGARSYAVKSLSRFENELLKRPFAVVCFYEESHSMHHDREYRQAIRSMDHGINALARLRRYKESGLNFIRANIAQEDMYQQAKKYGARQYPVYFLFKFGTPVKDAQGNVVRLEGFASSAQLQDFIENNLGQDLAKERERWAQDRLIRAEQAAYYWSSPYWGGYWGYPYYGGYWGWRRPYVGFGFGYYV